MTDGAGNVGTFESLFNKYHQVNRKIPIYSIMFADALQSQLNKISEMSNGKVFDGKTNLVEAFKEVREYN